MNRQEQADLIITNARAFTANRQQPWVESVAVRGSRIVFAGSAADAAAWRGPRTRVVDGQGATLLPGLVDSHFHLQWGSTNYEDASLEDIHGLDALAQAIRAQAARYPDKPWVTGHRLAYDVLGSERMVTRHDLDAIEPNRPVALMSFDYHALWANTRALELAGILHGASGAARQRDRDGGGRAGGRPAHRAGRISLRPGCDAAAERGRARPAAGAGAGRRRRAGASRACTTWTATRRRWRAMRRGPSRGG